MTKLEMSFKAIEKANPYWSSYTSLAVAVMGKGYGKMAIGQAFNKLVEKEDYARGEKEDIKKHLIRLTAKKEGGTVILSQ